MSGIVARVVGTNAWPIDASISSVQTWAAIFYALGALAELSGIALVVGEFRANRAHFREWEEANPKHNDDGSWGQQLLVNKIVTSLIGNAQRQVVAVAALVLGVVLGTVGNFLSLYS